MRLKELRHKMITELQTADVDEPELAVRLLLEDRLSLAPLTVPFYSGLEVNGACKKQLTEDIERLKQGEPLQYILGTQAFWDITLAVDPSVLIPRPETEELAQEAVRYLMDTGKRQVLDLCTGSGALALAIRKHVPDVDVTGSDLSQDALATAKKNAQTLALEIRWTKSDLLDGISGQFDLIVCNPPYIPTEEVDTLDRNVRGFEPRMALDGGEDGLCFYRRLAQDAPRHIREGGALFLEVGIGQADTVRMMLRDMFDTVVVRKDLEGIGRMVLATGRKEKTV